MMALTVELPWFIAGKLSPCHMIMLQMKYHFCSGRKQEHIFLNSILRIIQFICIDRIEK